jgi:hypothetical protein
MRRYLLFLVGLFLVVAPSLVRLYLLMPFPGSQGLDSLPLAYVLTRLRIPLLSAGAVMAVAGAARLLVRPVGWRRWAVVTAGLVLAVAVQLGLRTMSADAMFRPPSRLAFASMPPESLPPETLVLGVVVAGKARAYPVRLLAYHHFVLDEIEGQPLLPTY